MKKITNIEVELRKGNDDKISFHLKQYDDVILNIKVYDGLTPISLEGETVYLAIDKPDGTKILQKEDIVVDGYNIEVMLSTQAVVAPGVCKLELILESDNGLLTTAITNYMVTEALSTSIVDIITSSNDIHHLKLIEDFILNSNFAIEDITYSLNAIKERIRELEEEIETIGAEIIENVENTEDKAIENIEIVKDNALSEIDTAKSEILSKANEVIIKVETAKGEVNELMATIEASKEEVDEMGQAQVSNIMGAGRMAVRDVDEAKEDALDTIKVRTNLIVEEAGTEISRVKDEAINEITAKKDEVVALASEEMSNKKDEIVSLASDNLEEIKTNTINEMNETKESAINTITNTKNEAVEVIGNTKDTTIEEMTQAKDALIEELSRVETGTVEGVDEAVKLAQKRLQEETVKSMWKVQECTVTQKEAIEALSRQEQGNITKKTAENIERINNAGASIVEKVEGLEANIEQGLSDIDRTIREGKAEIRDLSSVEISKIRETGAEITEAVANLEINTTDNIDRINRAGEGARNTIEAKSLAEQREINRVASEQKTAIREAGNDKLEEINAILGVSKREVEELLSTTRQEINTHRSDFANKVAGSKEEIDNLKTNSINEMTNTKDDLVNEILGAEIALKEDFTALRDKYIAEIDAKGTSRVDALQRMIDAIDALEEAVNRRLEISEDRAETLENTLINVDNKIVEIRPVLDNLSEMRNICVSLQAENTEANANIEELDFLHIEADTRIVELRRLIEEAKQYEEVVQRYIDSKNGGHEEIEARLDALEEAIKNIITREEVEGIIEPIRADIEDIKDKMVTKGFIGKIGTGLYLDTENENFISAPEPDFEPVHTMKYQHNPNNAMMSYVVYFKTSLTDIENRKYIYMDDNTITGKITFNNMTKNEDYVVYRYQHGTTSGWVEVPTPQNASPLHKSTRIYYHDFPIYTVDGSAIIFDDATKSGVSDFDKAVEDGDYSINLSPDDFNSIYNGVKVSGASQVVGTLSVKSIGDKKIQILDLASYGLSYMRTIKGEWRNTTDGAISKNPLTNIKISEEGLPEFLRDIPPMPLYGQEVKDMLIFQANSTAYHVYRFLEGWTGRIYYTGSSSFYIGASNAKCYKMVYNSSTGEWNTKDTASTTTAVGSTSITRAYFRVLYNTMPVYSSSSSSSTDLYQDITIPVDGEVTIMDFNNAIDTGMYPVSIKSGDAILNSPLTSESETLEDGEIKRVVSEGIDGMLQVIKLGNDIYQELSSNDNVRAWKRTRVNGVWTDWRIIITEAMLYNLISV